MSANLIRKTLDDRWADGDLPRLHDMAPGWLQNRRDQGQDLALAHGVPSTRDERWRYTNVASALSEHDFIHASGQSVANVTQVPQAALDIDGIPIVLVNGRLSVQLSALSRLPSGVRIVSLSDALTDGDVDIETLMSIGDQMSTNGLRAANDAGSALGLVIRIDADAHVSTPLHVIHISTMPDEDQIYHPRFLVDLAHHAAATLVESYVCHDDQGASFQNIVTQIRLADGAKLNHIKWQREADTATHVATIDVDVSRDATYAAFVGHVGSALARHDTRVNIHGSGAHAAVSGIYLGRGKRVHDITTSVHHMVPHTTSQQMVRGVLSEGARGVFLGRAVVAQDAQKTDAQQMHNAMLLDNTAEVNAKPELEIYADDVQCAHGNTVGDIDTNALFYMQARGIEAATARAMLIEGFLTEVITASVPEPLQAVLVDAMLEVIA